MKAKNQTTPQLRLLKELSRVAMAESNGRTRDALALEVHLRSIQSAIDHLNRGTYGICEDCGGVMPRRRLRAIPWARYCQQCERMHAREMVLMAS